MSKINDITKNNIKSPEWYSDEKLNELLKHYVGAEHINISIALNTPDLLVEYLKQLAPSNKTHQVIPLNVSALTGDLGANSKHWVGLYILVNNNNASVKVDYINPMGHSIAHNIKRIIEDTLSKEFQSVSVEEPLLRQAIQYTTNVSEVEYEGNINDCGPILVYAMACFTRALKPIKINSLEESKSLGSFLRESFDRLDNFNNIHTTLNKHITSFVNTNIDNSVGNNNIQLKNFTQEKELVKLQIDDQQLTEIDKEIVELETKLFPNFRINSSEIPDPELGRQKIVESIRGSYVQGQQYFQEHNFEKAEQEFVKVLKPILSTPEKKKLASDNIKYLKDELLNSLYYLGKIYLAEDKYQEHHSKAAAIFQYCATFAKKYEVSIKSEENITGASDYFIRLAYLVEKEFIKSIEPGNNTKASNILDDNYYNSCNKSISEYKKDLEQVRSLTKQKLDKISNLTIEDIATRANAVENIYQECNSFFVNKEQQGLVQRLLNDCRKQLGNLPAGCEHTIIGLGSLALGTMTPWSDLEFAILINEDKEEYKEYFRNLTKLLQIKVINLGETILPILGIESLNNVKTGNEDDEWFWDNITPRGFSFDGKRWYACKSPLGRKGYKAIKKVKDNEGVEKTIFEDKPDYELILTPQQMAKFQQGMAKEVQQDNEEHQTKIWFNTDKHLVQALKSVRLIDGSQKLLDDYRQKAKEEEGEQITKERALEILKEDLEAFSLKLGDEEEGKLMDVKKDIYRITDRILVSLANYYDISAEPEETGLTVWQGLDKMLKQEILSKEGAQHLKEALATATELRLNTYYNNFGQRETISTYVPAVEHLSEEEKKKLLEETFHIKDTAILKYFYYVMLEMQSLVKVFCDQKYHEQAKLFLKSDKLFDDNNYNQGMVHARFLEYDKALKFMELAKKESVEDLDFLQDLYFLYITTSIIDKAIGVAEEILELNLAKYSNSLNYLSIAASHNNLGYAYSIKGEYDKALEHHNKALIILLEAYENNPNHSHIITVNYNNLGATYNRKGEYDKAIKHYNKALIILLEAYENSPNNHSAIANSYNNLGYAYSIKGEYDKALRYHQKALEIRQRTYENSPNHPCIATSYNNLGEISRNKGEFDKALKYYQEALEIRQKTYENSPNHSDIANSYNNLGVAHYHKGEYNKAIKHYNKALEIWQEVYENSPNHPCIATSYNNLGEIYRNKEEFDKALKYHQKALEIRQKLYENSPNHPNIATSYNNLGAAYWYKREYDKALKYHQKALEIWQKVYKNSPNHLDIAFSYNNLGTTYLEIKNPTMAIFYLSKAKDILLEAYKTSPNHPIITTLSNNFINATRLNEQRIHDIIELYDGTEYFEFMKKYLYSGIALTAKQINEIKGAKEHYKNIYPNKEIAFEDFFSLYPYEDNPDFFNEVNTIEIAKFAVNQAVKFILRLPTINMLIKSTENRVKQEERIKELEPICLGYLKQLYELGKLEEFLNLHIAKEISVKEVLASKLYQVCEYEGKIGFVNWNMISAKVPLINPNINTYNDYFASFQKYNNKEKLYQTSVLVNYLTKISNLFLPILSSQGIIKIMDIGYSNGTVTKAIVESFINFTRDATKILVYGTDIDARPLKAAISNVQQTNIPFDNIKLETGWFGSNKDGHNKSVEKIAYDFIFAGYLYNSHFLDMIKQGKLDEVMHKKSVFISIHSKYDYIEAFKTNYSNIFPSYASYCQKLSKVLNEKNYKVKSFYYDYSFEFPNVSSEEWECIEKIPTAKYDFDYKSFGSEHGDEGFVDKVNLLQFLFKGPIESIEQAKRKEILEEFKKELIIKDNKIHYKARVDVAIKDEDSLAEIDKAIIQLMNDYEIQALGLDLNVIN